MKIFIGYRRNDSAVFTGRLFDRLRDYYGDDSVFLDIVSISGGHDFREDISRHIKNCGVFLAVIGRQWAVSSNGEHSIHAPVDYVRTEIEQAIADNKPLIPVYCDHTEALTAEELPTTIERLAYAHACPIDSGKDFNHHVQDLRREINKVLFPTLWSFLLHVAIRFVRRNKLGLGLCAVAALLVYLGRDLVGPLLLTRQGVYSAVEAADPAAFSDGEGDAYQIARCLPNRTALVTETDMVDTIRDTKHTFDAFALTGSVFFNNTEALVDGLNRGVRFRILLLDHSEGNQGNVEAYFLHCAKTSNGPGWSKDNAMLAYATFSRLRQESQTSGSGSIEVRWWKGPFLNSFWVRDSGHSDTSLAHTEFTYFGDVSLNPSVRYGNLSPKMVDSLQAQFEYMWASSE